MYLDDRINTQFVQTYKSGANANRYCDSDILNTPQLLLFNAVLFKLDLIEYFNTHAIISTWLPTYFLPLVLLVIFYISFEPSSGFKGHYLIPVGNLLPIALFE